MCRGRVEKEEKISLRETREKIEDRWVEIGLFLEKKCSKFIEIGIELYYYICAI